MTAVFGIDPAWTESEPSGLTLVAREDRAWVCKALAPSYQSFLAQGPVDWNAKSVPGSVPDIAALLNKCADLHGGCAPAVVAIDMPVATVAISSRRNADNALSANFGSVGCGTHSPNAQRPGPLGSAMTAAFANHGFRVATSKTPVGEEGRLVEVYPHPALLALLGCTYRVPYKVSKSGKYWPGTSVAHRAAKLLEVFDAILTGLRRNIADIPMRLPLASEVPSLAGLKRYEDAIDALVCAWCGIMYLEGKAIPYGDDTAAIWVPTQAGMVSA